MFNVQHILFVQSTLPNPNQFSGKIDFFNILKRLAFQCFNVSMFYICYWSLDSTADTVSACLQLSLISSDYSSDSRHAVVDWLTVWSCLLDLGQGAGFTNALPFSVTKLECGVLHLQGLSEWLGILYNTVYGIIILYQRLQGEMWWIQNIVWKIYTNIYNRYSKCNLMGVPLLQKLAAAADDLSIFIQQHLHSIMLISYSIHTSTRW